MKLQYLLLGSQFVILCQKTWLVFFENEMDYSARFGIKRPISGSRAIYEVSSSNGKDLGNKRVLVFGYGGRFAVGAELLKQGASHVVLCDHHVLLDKERNLKLLPLYGDYLMMQDGEARPKPEYITLLHGDIHKINPISNC